MNDWRFSGWLNYLDFSFSSNLWLFCCANPKVWMIRFFTQLRAFLRFHYFKVTFYRWPDISKICDRLSSCKYFWSFVSTMYQPELLTIVDIYNCYILLNIIVLFV
jgi:hypothetical protein